jgi:hypothetical protein
MKNTIMSFVGKWMELEIIMLNKISQTQKDKCFLSYEESRFFFKCMKVERELYGRRGTICEDKGDWCGMVMGVTMIKVHYIHI